jgi:hypothetical protein
VVEHSDIERFLQEAQALTAVGDYSKAPAIYGSLIVPEMVGAVPAYSHNQHVAINYANCLIALGRVELAIKTLHCFAAANEKPDEYFVNLSLAQIRRRDHRAATSTAFAGTTDLLRGSRCSFTP